MSKRNRPENIYPLLEKVEQGSMTRKEFCSRTGLKECSFHYWRQRFRKENRPENTFVELSQLGMDCEHHLMEIELNTGVKLRFSSLVPIEYLGRILQMQ